jgi:hypothetical protein
VLSAALAACVHSAPAQTAKPPPRLPPTPSQTSQIPGGVDTGTPGGSDSLQLGTPVMSNATGQPSGRGMSAAARAAARPKPAASSTDCTKTVTPTTSDNKATPATLPKATIPGNAKPPAKTPVAPGASRIDC